MWAVVQSSLFKINLSLFSKQISLPTQVGGSLCLPQLGTFVHQKAIKVSKQASVTLNIESRVLTKFSASSCTQ